MAYPAQAGFERVLATTKEGGIPLAVKKLRKPCTKLEYQEFAISTETMNTDITQGKD